MSWLSAFLDAHSPIEQRVERAQKGALHSTVDLSTLVARDLATFITQLTPTQLLIGWRLLSTEPYPGRSEALLAIAHATGARVPESEYVLREETLDGLLERAKSLTGEKLVLSGKAGHKGRIGDAVERLLIGNRATGKHSDHRAAEIKSVPVQGNRILERVKLGVVSENSNPLLKCDRILFIFVEQRGDDYFVCGHAVAEFDAARWHRMWEARHVVETAAGSAADKRRGLYLVPKWFRDAGLW